MKQNETAAPLTTSDTAAHSHEDTTSIVPQLTADYADGGLRTLGDDSARIERVLEALQVNPVKGKSGEFLARCPAHGDKHPSLSVTVKPEGKILLCCRSQGCDTQAIAAAAGLSVADLFPPKTKSSSNDHQILATYDYKDEAGNLLFQVVRFAPKGFRQRRPNGSDTWIWNLDGTRRVLYRLPEMIEAIRHGRTIYLPEGEKDADNLRSRGADATTSPQGAGKWKTEYTESLRGARVVLLPDNDEPGRLHAATVATQLHEVAASVKILALPGLPEKGDVSDWLARGGTTDELARLADATPPFVPTPRETTTNTTQSPAPTSFSPELVVFVVENAGSWDSRKWESILPFGEYAVPRFPSECLPNWLSEYVTALATETQTPVDMAGVQALAVCAASCAKTAQIDCGWIEPLNLYSVVSMPPASRKSRVVQAMSEPIEDTDRQRIADAKSEVAASENELRILEGRLKRAQKDAAEAKGENDRLIAKSEAEALTRQIAAFEPIASPRLLADDCTPEKLASLLAEQGGRMAVFSAEGDTFALMAGRYSDKEPNLGVYLKSHPGDAIRADRISRGAVSIDRPALTFGLAVQPDVLDGIASKPGMRERGLLARFLYSTPAPNVGYRDIDAPRVPPEIEARYSAGVKSLLALNPVTDGAPPSIGLDTDAARLFREERKRVERELLPGESLSDLADWAGKLCGAIARIAGLLTLAESAGGAGGFSASSLAVSGSTMTAAIHLGAYFTAHARAAFGTMGADRSFADAQALVKWLKRKELTTFTKREAQNMNASRFKTAADLDKPLELLSERGYVRRREDQRGGTGPKQALYAVHPDLLSPEILRQVRQDSPITLSLSSEGVRLAHSATEVRQARKRFHPAAHSNGSPQLDYEKTLYGTVAEIAIVGWLESNRVPVAGWTLASEGAAPDGCDFMIDTLKMEVKASPPGSNFVTISKEQHEDASRRADYYLVALCLDDRTVSLVAPIPYDEVTTWELCKGAKVPGESGDALRCDFYRRHRTELEPLVTIAQVRELLPNAVARNGDPFDLD